MPKPADIQIAKAETDAEQPGLRRRRTRRRDGSDSDDWTGSFEAVTPNISSVPVLPVRSSSWAEAAAVADALSGAPAAPPAPDRKPAAAPASSVPEPAAEPEQPKADATALPTSFVREQKPRPKRGFRGFLYRVTGGSLNMGPSALEREE